MLLFDHGARRSGVPAELERLGVELRGVRLPAGDYVLSDRLVVERKGPTDLAASIKDRRLVEQLARLGDAYPSARATGPHAPSALAGRAHPGASALRTSDARETAERVARLYRLEGKPASRPHGMPRVRRPTEDDLADG